MTSLTNHNHPSIHILSHTQKSYAEAIYSILGKGLEHASLLYSEFFRTGKALGSHPAFHNAQKILTEIISHTNFSLPEISYQYQSNETVKFLLKLNDGYEIESVIIPMKYGYSLCVSSQVGCRMGCTFCQTGRMGLWRHLTTSEIVSQLFVARHILNYDICNIVFMGMGEPMDNFDAVKGAIACFTDPKGFNLGYRHITISTSGRIDGIQRMIHEYHPAINLAVSINGSNDLIRTKLMPINRKYNMTALKNTLKEYCAHPRRSILIEYILIKNYTDSLESADELAAYLEGIRVKVNLIPYNPQKPTTFEATHLEQAEAFASRMRLHGYRVLLRKTKGSQIMAACGQLGNID